MANINLVNLNDAVYRLLNPGFKWLGGTTTDMDIDAFNTVNCPLLHNHDRREVVTYKDWVSIMAGNPNVLDTYGARKSRCAAISEYAPYTQAYRPWGRTLGKYAGPGGKPLAEVKPLDEMFWYYDAFDRRMKGGPANALNPCIISGFYHNNGWQFAIANDGVTDNTQGWHTLEPGVYGAANWSYYDNTCGWVVLDETGVLKGERQFTQIYSPGQIWRGQNAIFFVDSPVKMRANWAGGTYTIMQGTIFRITPPGYWC